MSRSSAAALTLVLAASSALFIALLFATAMLRTRGLALEGPPLWSVGVLALAAVLSRFRSLAAVCAVAFIAGQHPAPLAVAQGVFVVAAVLTRQRALAVFNVVVAVSAWLSSCL